jgi:hypothetical protein
MVPDSLRANVAAKARFPSANQPLTQVAGVDTTEPVMKETKI